jgi:hypothetical protein
MAVSRSKLDRMNIRLVLAADALRLESDCCWRLGLLVHELITNSARHASFDNQRGKIKIELKRSSALVHCTVSAASASQCALCRLFPICGKMRAPPWVRRLTMGLCGRRGGRARRARAGSGRQSQAVNFQYPNFLSETWFESRRPVRYCEFLPRKAYRAM